MTDNLQPRNYTSKEATRAAVLNASQYVFTTFRDLNIRGMHINFPKMERCKLYLVETFPEYKPSPHALVENGQVVIVETMIPALYQINTLREAYKQEGLTAIDCSYERAVEINNYLAAVKDMTLKEAAEYLRTHVQHAATKNVLVGAFDQAFRHAENIIATTRKEIQRARSGKSGKAYLDQRDQLACRLTDTTELSLLAPEGAAAQNTIRNLVGELKNVMSPEVEVSAVEELVKIVKQQGEEIKKLKAKSND